MDAEARISQCQSEITALKADLAALEVLVSQRFEHLLGTDFQSAPQGDQTEAHVLKSQTPD